MDAKAKELAEKVLSLPLDEQVLVAHHIWENIEHFADPEVEKAWLEEADRRWREIEEGKVECIPADEAMGRAKAALKNRS